MHRLFRHKLLAAVVALLVAGSAGGAYAATQTGTNSRQAFLGDVAKRLGVTPSRLRAAVNGALEDRLNAAVKAGRLTQAQANQIKQRIERGGPPALGPMGGPMLRRRFGPPAFRPGLRRGLLGTAASYLGVSDAQLLGDLRGGKSLAQIAQAQNKSVSGLEQALVNAAQARLAGLVSSGVLTKAQEQRLLNRLNARINRLLNAHPKMFREVRPAPPAPGPALGGPGAPPPPTA